MDDAGIGRGGHRLAASLFGIPVLRREFRLVYCSLIERAAASGKDPGETQLPGT